MQHEGLAQMCFLMRAPRKTVHSQLSRGNWIQICSPPPPSTLTVITNWLGVLRFLQNHLSAQSLLTAFYLCLFEGEMIHGRDIGPNSASRW